MARIGCEIRIIWMITVGREGRTDPELFVLRRGFPSELVPCTHGSMPNTNNVSLIAPSLHSHQNSL